MHPKSDFACLVRTGQFFTTLRPAMGFAGASGTEAAAATDTVAHARTSPRHGRVAEEAGWTNWDVSRHVGGTFVPIRESASGAATARARVRTHEHGHEATTFVFLKLFKKQQVLQSIGVTSVPTSPPQGITPTSSSAAGAIAPLPAVR